MEGVEPSDASIEHEQLRAGQFIDRTELAHVVRVNVLGPTAVDSLFGSTADNPIGAQVNVDGTALRVVGVLEPKGSSAHPAAEHDRAHPRVHRAGPLHRRLERLLRSGGVGHLFDHRRVESASTLVSASSSSSRTFTDLLGAVAANSLFVGGSGSRTSCP